MVLMNERDVVINVISCSMESGMSPCMHPGFTLVPVVGKPGVDRVTRCMCVNGDLLIGACM